MRRRTQIARLLAKAIALDGAQFGNIQAFEPQTKTLRIVAAQGFKEDFLEHFRCVKAFDSSACGRAAGLGGIVIIADVQADPAFAAHRAVAACAGFRSVKSAPIRDDDGDLLGILSTHCRARRAHWDVSATAPVIAELARLLRAAPVV